VMSVWLRGAVTAAVLLYLVSRIDVAGTLASVAGISAATVAAVVVLAAIDRGLMAWRWILLVRATGVSLATGAGLRLFLVSSFLGSFAPAGIGGDIARTWQLGQRTARTTDAVAAAVVDRWLGLLAVAMLGVFGLARWTSNLDARVSLAMHLLLVALMAGAGLALHADRVVSRLMPAAWASRAPGALLLRLAAALGSFRGRGLTLLWVAALSLAVQVLRVVLAWVIGRGLGIAVGFEHYLVVMPVGIVLILLPISLGGFGPAQGAIVWMMKPLGVDEGLAFAMSTLFVLVGTAANLPGAVLYLRGRQ
jgi:glycosyltransferase 2 family protein